MIYYLLYLEWGLQDQIGAFNVFRYITFRTAMATLTALLVALLLGPWMIRRLQQFQIGQEIREEGPASHHSKQGTPTMGGLLIITAVVLPTILWADPSNRFTWIAIGSTVAFGGIGFIDDYLKVAKKHNLGLRARTKFGMQIGIALVIGIALHRLASAGVFTTQMIFPFFKNFTPDLGWFYLGVVVLVLVASSNAVNLTDGLDGLAIGSLLIAWTAFTVLVYAAGHAIVADYLGIFTVKGVAELTVFCGAVLGACLGFLWFNSHPAEIFMGDVGSMAMGGALGTVAILIKQELLLILVGGLFVLEALSVILQVGSFKLRGRRIFRMAPLHHHFELSGWSESKVVIRFWIMAIIFALLALATLKLR
ncbi:MAG: phospho-N-acetylmuramoyl-pentapeptide-transferase [Acidobacteria bacterium]|nr:phospho-N-acetylmuramoyl-pentapeptide-transferase [Acidobacteriota bacterium]NIM60257.1 phospho-N-acetylmuramoyl-pentapeptide-transferase [Acidobacteriota bacterium]NIO60295.1 phospho-N-acetylmuramoyl-pentapeptide-transferase [Acidobacteriota bacterium]NIQ31350.1 phospho-N-acetylmuramoyl-pentapeptide-transferase [Acidobacteriota bacterium]NIQ86573.1 phospho-N-acetylmuramoyl-pentapeptide-transferase [Acidobacteriota bacterium]